MPPLRCAYLVALVCLGVGGFAAESTAQRQREAPKPESKTLTTKDGVQVRIKYYASNAGREATPVILIHDLKESGQVLSRLARWLQQPPSDADFPPFAVVAVDLRGHGDSRKQSYQGRERELDPVKLSVGDMRGMVLGDMEAVRKFLVSENDAGRLNLNRLAVVGCGMGAVVATNFAANDWAAPKLAAVKQGQDVKALVLVSPEWKSKGLSMQQPLRQPGVQREVAFLMLYGDQDRRRKRDVERIYGQLERGRPELRGLEDQDLVASLNQLPVVTKIGSKTKMQGTQLLEEKRGKAEQLIARFLAKHTSDKEYGHSVRRLE